MLSRIQLLGSFIVLMTACGSNGVNKTGKVELNSDSSKKDVITSPVSDACDTLVIKGAAFSLQDDRFISSVLENELSCKNIDGIFKDSKRAFKISKNKFAAELYDTVMIYKVNCDTMSYLSTKDNCFPLYMSIQSSRLTLDNGTIKVGLEKEKFVERFHLRKATADAIKVTDLEGGNELIFAFKSNKLSRIVYNNLYVE
jgi:hypothetical protein